MRTAAHRDCFPRASTGINLGRLLGVICHPYALLLVRPISRSLFFINPLGDSNSFKMKHIRFGDFSKSLKKRRWGSVWHQSTGIVHWIPGPTTDQASGLYKLESQEFKACDNPKINFSLKLMLLIDAYSVGKGKIIPFSPSISSYNAFQI